MCTQERAFDREIQEINRQAALMWRRRFGAMFEEIMRVYRPREPLDVDQLADMVSTVLEGGIILSKALKQPESLPQQLLVLRSFVRLLFQPAV